MAHETADVVLLGNDLVRLVVMLKVARRTHGIIWQNFAGTIIVDLAGIILASIGLFGPLLAASSTSPRNSHSSLIWPGCSPTGRKLIVA